ncbi:MAG: 4a-hydroxytetrahydrobiopterin dehydratase [Verrucomicrobiales bacterium]
MPSDDVITKDEARPFLKKVPEWDMEETVITRTFEFEDFSEALDFVNDVGEIAEESQHHPDIDIRYNKVMLLLTTHDKGGVTEADFAMAARIDNLVD